MCRLFKTHLSVLIFARKVSFMVVHSHIKVGEKKKYYKSAIQLVFNLIKGLHRRKIPFSFSFVRSH